MINLYMIILGKRKSCPRFTVILQTKKVHLDLSNQLLNLNLDGKKDMNNLKLNLDNHNKSLQIFLCDKERCLAHISELESQFKIEI